MTKADISSAVYSRHGGMSRRESAEIVDMILGRIKQALTGGERVQISRFGVLEVAQRRPRDCRDPRTGDRIRIGARRTVVFKPSRLLVENLNAGAEDAPEAESRAL